MTERNVGVYPASFDPITNGHLDLIDRASRLVDDLIVWEVTGVECRGVEKRLDGRAGGLAPEDGPVVLPIRF